MTRIQIALTSAFIALALVISVIQGCGKTDTQPTVTLKGGVSQ